MSGDVSGDGDAAPRAACRRAGAQERSENRRRFEAARHALGWSIARTARSLEVAPKLVEGWLYERRRDVPRMAVLALEAFANQRPADGGSSLTRADRYQFILDSLSAGRSLRLISRDLGIADVSVQQMIQEYPALRAALSKALASRKAELTARRHIKEQRAKEREDKRATRDNLLPAAIEQVQQGRTVKAVATEIGLPEWSLQEATRGMDRLHLHAYSKDLPERYVQAASVVKAGGSYEDARQMTGLSRPTVVKACRLLGVVSRRGRRRYPAKAKGAAGDTGAPLPFKEVRS